MIPESIRRAARALLDKKATDVVALELKEFSSVTDHFLLASGSNQRQLVALADAVRATLREMGLRPSHMEGYPRQEWILMDYGDLVVHIFSERSRGFYDIERLWSEARREVLT